jgi:hypothetical protein
MFNCILHDTVALNVNGNRKYWWNISRYHHGISIEGLRERETSGVIVFSKLGSSCMLGRGTAELTSIKRYAWLFISFMTPIKFLNACSTDRNMEG